MAVYSLVGWFFYHDGRRSKAENIPLERWLAQNSPVSGGASGVRRTYDNDDVDVSLVVLAAVKVSIEVPCSKRSMVPSR